MEATLSNHPAVLEFKQVALDYCSLVESQLEYLLPEFVILCQALLSKLYSKALVLPEFMPTDPSIAESTISHDEWAKIFNALRAKFGKHDSYWLVFNPYFPGKDDPVQGSLADDIADIYRDLKVGLNCWGSDSKSKVEDSVWHWKFNFEQHWGRHLGEALRALYTLRFDYLLEE